MKHIAQSIARWIDRSDAGEITSIIFVAALAVGGVLCALAVVVHGFPK